MAPPPPLPAPPSPPAAKAPLVRSTGAGHMGRLKRTSQLLIRSHLKPRSLLPLDHPTQQNKAVCHKKGPMVLCQSQNLLHQEQLGRLLAIALRQVANRRVKQTLDCRYIFSCRYLGLQSVLERWQPRQPQGQVHARVHRAACPRKENPLQIQLGLRPSSPRHQEKKVGSRRGGVDPRSAFKHRTWR